MIEKKKKYLVDGWAIHLIIDIIESLKWQVEKNKKSYPSAEFLSIVDSYDFAINYLFNLKNEESTDIYGDDAIQKDLEEFLKKMKIIIKSENRKDEDDSRTEKE